MTLLQAILCGLVAAYGRVDALFGTLYLQRPIFWEFNLDSGSLYNN